MVEQISVMIAAMVISVIVMLAMSGMISTFVERNPTIKILALSFLILIGSMLVMEAWDGMWRKAISTLLWHFSLVVEFLNMRYRRKHAN